MPHILNYNKPLTSVQKVTKYQYDESMSSSYREAFYKLYRKQIDDSFFKFIVVDAIMSSAILVDKFVSYGANKGFKVKSKICIYIYHCLVFLKFLKFILISITIFTKFVVSEYCKLNYDL